MPGKGVRGFASHEHVTYPGYAMSDFQGCNNIIGSLSAYGKVASLRRSVFIPPLLDLKLVAENSSFPSFCCVVVWH